MPKLMTMILEEQIMKTADAISHFETASALAERLSITRGAVSQWGEFVPENRANQLSRITDGKLVYDYEFYRQLEVETKNKKQAA